ncbi:SDR family NAD(P)-dependent oxidoreductase [Halapricum sp. CBA1109]|uniref:SDR family NAD(P)-dependent oxidoreductase n=1 Tax=Halapricum sp. CBA1109 TaxID=2668068 RepID=UPI0012FCEB42|nr:SDR family NAD(P)-dependent oxidoreductase [Halapricum sp. CBA1109]MUV90114.1 SDR family NAD(P)-dependent oxidoreductase [Halapricum sp. CBA1109]
MARTAVVAGVGPGLGASVAEQFASEGLNVGLLARSESFIESLADTLSETAGDAVAVPCDLADPTDIEAAFADVREAFGPVDVLVNHASAAPWKGLQAISDEEFQGALDVGPRAALHCSQEAVEDILETAGDGTIIFTGATTSVRGRAGSIGFSAAKFATRGMAESMARELGPEGVHVAHVVIDGQILPPDGPGDRDESEFLDPDTIAESYWHLVEQDRSAWTLELDVRPHVEEF